MRTAAVATLGHASSKAGIGMAKETPEMKTTSPEPAVIKGRRGTGSIHR